jgi:hypothetical protein
MTPTLRGLEAAGGATGEGQQHARAAVGCREASLDVGVVGHGAEGFLDLQPQRGGGEHRGQEKFALLAD